MAKESTALEKIERIIRNLPIFETEYWFIDTKSGRLYFGMGRDANNCYHGVWAFLRGPGVARDLHFAKDQPKELVVKALVEDGCEMLLNMEAKGLLMEGAWGRG